MTHSTENSENLKSTKRRKTSNRDTTVMIIRRELALILVGFIVIVALVAVVQSGAMSILDKFLPAIMLVLGFFFGQRANYR